MIRKSFPMENERRSNVGEQVSTKNICMSAVKVRYSLLEKVYL